MSNVLRLKSRPGPEQLLEWTENPVTIAFRAVAEDYRDRAASTDVDDFYHRGEAMKTQEMIAGIVAVVDTWDIVVKLLSKEGMQEEMDEYFK